MESTTAFVAYFEAGFGDPDEKGTARRKLRNIADRNEYFARFRELNAVLGWVDQKPIRQSH